MAGCCSEKSCDIDKLASSQRRVLWLVLAINAIMFLVEAVAGWRGESLALTGDSLDMAGDAVAYGASLWAINHGLQGKAKAARIKAWLMVIVGLSALIQAVRHLFGDIQPEAWIMGPVGGLALAANLVCLLALTRHRSDDINMQSVWICSRNDIIANTAVLGAAAWVGLSGSRWPDFFVGLGIMTLFFRSAVTVFRDSRLASIEGARPLKQSSAGGAKA